MRQYPVNIVRASIELSNSLQRGAPVKLYMNSPQGITEVLNVQRSHDSLWHHNDTGKYWVQTEHCKRCHVWTTDREFYVMTPEEAIIQQEYLDGKRSDI